MKKIIAALVAGVMMVGFTAPTFAAINPANIDESSSKVNIYKKVWKQVNEKDIHAGVVGFFAWAHIDGTIYSVALSQLRKHGDPSKAFADIVGAELAIDQAANLVGALETRVSDNNGRISTVITTVDAAGLADAQAEIAQLSADNAELERLIGSYDPLGEGWSHDEFLQEFVTYYGRLVADGVTTDELPEETFRGLTGGLVDVIDGLRLEILAHQAELRAIEDQLDNIHATIDQLGDLGWESDLVWDSKTLLEKATLIAEKVPNLTEELDHLSRQLAEAGPLATAISDLLVSDEYDDVIIDLQDELGREPTAAEKLQGIINVATSVAENIGFENGQTDVRMTLTQIAEMTGFRQSTTNPFDPADAADVTALVQFLKVTVDDHAGAIIALNPAFGWSGYDSSLDLEANVQALVAEVSSITIPATAGWDAALEGLNGPNSPVVYTAAVDSVRANHDVAEGVYFIAQDGGQNGDGFVIRVNQYGKVVRTGGSDSFQRVSTGAPSGATTLTGSITQQEANMLYTPTHAAELLVTSGATGTFQHRVDGSDAMVTIRTSLIGEGFSRAGTAGNYEVPSAQEALDRYNALTVNDIQVLTIEAAIESAYGQGYEDGYSEGYAHGFEDGWNAQAAAGRT